MRRAVTPRSLLLAVKLHRVELAFAALASVVVGLAALYVTWRLAGLSVPRACLGSWVGATPEDCLSYLRTAGIIYHEEGSRVLAIMAVLPAAVGLLGGVPIVGRELESGTAEFAWAVAPSRRRWLLRQVAAVGLPLVAAFGFAAAAADILEATRRTFMPAGASENLGLHGTLAFVRMLGAFGVGLFLGAVTGRTLPAFAAGALVMAGLVVAAGGARDAWTRMQPTVVIDTLAGDRFDGDIVGLAWIDPSGELVPYASAQARVPAGAEGDPDSWLMDHGYEQILLGITKETAEGWQRLEFVGWLGGALALTAGSAWVVDRRRPL